MKMKAILLVGSLALAASAQQLSPKGGNFYSLENERKLGLSTAATLERMLPVVREPKLDAYVAKLGEALAKYGNSPFPFSFTLFEDRRQDDASHAAGVPGILPIMPLDAFQGVATEPVAVAGGPIFVPLSLLADSPNEAVLAFQLAHAMAHIADRHATWFMTQTDLTAAKGIAPRFNALCWPENGLDKRADFVAVAVISQAGYSPQAIAAYLAAQPARKRAGCPFPTHATPKQRAQAIRSQFARLAPASYDAATGGFDEAKALAATVR